MSNVKGIASAGNNVFKDQSDTLQIPKKVISKIAKTYHKQNLAQEVADHEDFVELYEKITAK